MADLDGDLVHHEVEPLVGQAIALWELAGLNAERLAVLRSLSIEVSDLPGRSLGLALPDRVILDADAAGYGWWTGFESRVAGIESRDPELETRDSSYDLLSAVMHEMGHVLGLDHDQDGDDLMADILQPGQRRLPTLADIDEILAQGDWLE